MKKIQSTRREYGNKELTDEEITVNPFTLFNTWLNQAIESGMLDASAMVLATVDENSKPDSRVVLLKDIDEQGFIFFTHYDSPKAAQAENSGTVALNFYWRELSKQIRIRGHIERISREASETYFASRPRGSQISTLASNQSTVIKNRDDLVKTVAQLTEEYQEQNIPCPSYWGGYRVVPFEFEFFLGRDNRLNDRVRYRLEDKQWLIERLSP
jgi:pyridoxamine 5'-phosphate oxidase